MPATPVFTVSPVMNCATLRAFRRRPGTDHTLRNFRVMASLPLLAIQAGFYAKPLQKFRGRSFHAVRWPPSIQNLWFCFLSIAVFKSYLYFISERFKQVNLANSMMPIVDAVHGAIRGSVVFNRVEQTSIDTV